MHIRRRNRLRNFSTTDFLLSVVRLPLRKFGSYLANYLRVQMMSAANHQWRVAWMNDVKREKHERDCHLCKVKVNWRWPKGSA